LATITRPSEFTRATGVDPAVKVGRTAASMAATGTSAAATPRNVPAVETTGLANVHT
jgi:hypothetical protein